MRVRARCSATGFNFQDESPREAGSKTLVDEARSTEDTVSGNEMPADVRPVGGKWKAGRAAS